MKITRFFILFIAAAVSVAAQSRDDVRIYIPLVVAVDPAQADFFKQNFTMEITAAGYSVTENVTEADYSLRLRVSPNMITYDDGTSEQAPPGEDQYLLQINLMRNSDNSQIVSLAFGFSEVEEMYNHTLSLVYQTLANVPISKGGDDKTVVKFMVGKEEDRTDWWRNKWLYLRISLDFPISYYQLIKSDDFYRNDFIYDGDIQNPIRYSRINHQIIPMPGVTAGMELQFLNWMSLEVNGEIRLGDAAGGAFIPGVGAQLKFPIKPSTLFMLEPYVTGVFSTNTAEHSVSFPPFSLGGGLQLGVKGGSNGVFFFDANVIFSPGEAVTRNLDTRFPQPDTLHWKRFVIGLSLGYKAGFINRVSKEEEHPTWLFNHN